MTEDRTPPEARPMRLLLAVTGSIAAINIPSYLFVFVNTYGWHVKVVVSGAATRFVSPAALAVISGEPVSGPDWDYAAPVPIHRDLADWADTAIVLPATQNTVAKLSAGMADTLLLATVQGVRGNKIIAPALLQPMQESPAARRNLTTLRNDGYTVLSAGTARSAADNRPREGLPPLDQIVAALVDGRKAPA